MNDVYYEYDLSSQLPNCNDATSTEYEIKPTATTTLPNFNTYSLDTSYDESNDILSSHRYPRSMTHTDDNVAVEASATNTITSMNFDNRKPTISLNIAEERGQNPNADIQDIITGIVKLLNGNVIAQNSVQQNPFQSTRRYTTRINNRGPPRISDLPVLLPNIDEKYGANVHKTTSFASGIRKPAIPYPFDLPDMRTQILPPPVPMNEQQQHQIKVQHGGNKQIHTTITPNRLPPWHGNRTRQPIIGNTNRLQIPTRSTLTHPPQTTQDYRMPTKNPNPNPTTTFYTRTTEKMNLSDEYLNNKTLFGDNRNETPTQTESIGIGEPFKKLDIFMKPNKTTPFSFIDEETTNTPKTELIVSTTEEQNSTTILPQIIDSANERETFTTKSVLPSTESVISTSASTYSTHKIHEFLYQESSTTPTLKEIPSSQKPEITSSTTLIESNENLTTSVQDTSTTSISPSKVSKINQQIESTEFKSYYSRPGIVLDDTIDFSRRTNNNANVKAPLLSTSFHQVHGNDVNIQSTATLSNIYAEIFDVTLSAIQGPGHNKVVDLIEIENTEKSELRPTKLHPNDIIVSASDDNSFVSIDGKRTYINLFGETAENDHLRKPNLSTKTYTEHSVTPHQLKPVSS